MGFRGQEIKNECQENKGVFRGKFLELLSDKFCWEYKIWMYSEKIRKDRCFRKAVDKEILLQ